MIPLSWDPPHLLVALWGRGGDTAGKGALKAHPLGASLLSVPFPDPSCPGGMQQPLGMLELSLFVARTGKGSCWCPRGAALPGAGGKWEAPHIWGTDADNGFGLIPGWRRFQLNQFQTCSAPPSRPGRGSSSFPLPLVPPQPGKSLEYQWIGGAGPSPATKKGFGFSCFRSWGVGALQEFWQGFREGLLASCPGRCSDTDVS